MLPIPHGAAVALERLIGYQGHQTSRTGRHASVYASVYADVCNDAVMRSLPPPLPSSDAIRCDTLRYVACCSTRRTYAHALRGIPHMRHVSFHSILSEEARGKGISCQRMRIATHGARNSEGATVSEVESGRGHSTNLVASPALRMRLRSRLKVFCSFPARLRCIVRHAATSLSAFASSTSAAIASVAFGSGGVCWSCNCLSCASNVAICALAATSW